MPNHVHLILVPETQDGLARALGAAHRRWANFVNARGRWRGRLFDGRFASVAMDEAHLLAAVRYVAMNPVRARLVARARAQDWRWSSVRAHLAGADDGLVTVASNLKPDRRFRRAGGRGCGCFCRRRPQEGGADWSPRGNGDVHRRSGAPSRPTRRPPRPGPKARPTVDGAPVPPVAINWSLVLLSTFSMFLGTC